MKSLSKNSSGGRPKPAMNVTPLVDVVLVLLIIFMVVLPNMEKGAPVEVPGAENAQDDPDGETPFVLTVDLDGGMHFEDKGLDDTDFQTTLSSAHAAEPERKLILRGDKKTRYKRIRDLFKICQKIGFPGVSLRINAQETVSVASAGGA